MSIAKSRWFVLIASVTITIMAGSGGALAQTTVASEAGRINVVTVAEGLRSPWGLAFLPDGRMLVTERPGQMRIVSTTGELSPPLAGVPAVHAQGQGGLLDVVLSPAFAHDARIYFSYAEPTRRGARTAIARAVLNADALRLDQVDILFTQSEDPSGRHHFGSRLAFAPDGSLFAGLGDRSSYRDRAQDLDSHLGKIIRIMPDGSIPADNPFIGQSGVLPEIWSYGHRNIQGAAIHPETGVLWTHEHGPQGGDEVNAGKPGANFGWPVITHGREYGTGFRIGDGTERDDVEPSVHYWTPSIAPAGMAFYTGEVFPQWRGNLFIGALRGQLLSRLVLEEGQVVREERLLTELRSRFRDVRQGPDGHLYLLDESNGRILRLDPA